MDLEFEEQIEIVRAAKAVPNSFKSLLFVPRYRPQLAVVIAMPIFQQWTVWPFVSPRCLYDHFSEQHFTQAQCRVPLTQCLTMTANERARLQLSC